MSTSRGRTCSFVIIMKTAGSIVTVLVVALCSTVSSQRILVDDLELTTEMGKYAGPSDISFTQDGTLWACNKVGILTVSTSNNYDKPRSVLDLRDVLCENGERGLLGVAPHFDFGRNNPYVYLIYTYKKYGNCNENGSNGPVTRLSRFTCNAAGDLDCDIDSEEVFLESPSFPFDHHNSGAVKFGMDSLLYATIGDGGISSTAQDRSNLFGSVVRLTPDNKIPPTNPYSIESGFLDSVRCGSRNGESGNTNKRCQEIFAYGLRNPFRIAMNPNKDKTEFYINDVGASLWEEVDKAGYGFEGANYGWPVREGPCKKGSDCGTLCRKDNTYIEPVHFYHHDGNHEGAITGGAFVPNGVWSSDYDGKYIYADYVFGAIFVMDFRGGGNRDSCPLKSDYQATKIVEFAESAPSAMAFNPSDGALYYLTRGFGGRLNRIRFTGASNRPPQPAIRTSSNGGKVGTTIEFDATDSSDPEGNNLSFEWDFDGDGVIDSYDAIDSFRYVEEGIFVVTLKVRDGKGGRQSTSVTIGIGKYPIASIITPPSGKSFFVGQIFTLTGEATGDNIGSPEQSMTWEVKQHHGDHFHPFLEPTNGNEVRLQPAPSPEDLLASENSYLEVILTVTNEFGLSTTVSRNLMPRMRDVKIDSFPTGRTLIVDESEVVTPTKFKSWANHPLKLEAPDSDWFAWTNGGDQNQVVTVPMENEYLRVDAFFGDSPFFGCFAGDTTVQVMNRGAISMKDLAIGDYVKVAGGKFSQVYSFGHYEQHAKVAYLSIYTGLEKPLLITRDHMLLVNSEHIPASLVRIGDNLTLEDGGFVSVQSIQHVVLQGAFAPFTKDGTLVVNDVVASSFVALESDSASLVIGGTETLSLHYLAYLFESPHRLLCGVNFALCTSETYSDVGLSWWIEGPLVFSKWLLCQSGLVKLMVVIPAMSFFCIVLIIEVASTTLCLLIVPLMVSLTWKRIFNRKRTRC